MNADAARAGLVTMLRGKCLMFRAFVCLLALCAATLVHARNEGVTADEIRLGASVVLSGPLGP